jgi:SAM-dependent methyltransferase
VTTQSERDAWLNIIKPAELDAHMLSIGQAETNASIVQEMFRRFPLLESAKLLVHGCGSCQMFDYLSLENLGKVELTFADFSPAMLEEGKRRLERFQGTDWKVVLDDIEDSRLSGNFDAVLLVLVLLHVDWRRGIENLLRLSPTRFYVVEQEQTPDASSITMKDKLPPSIERYSEIAEMDLVPQNDLVDFLGMKGYRTLWTSSRPVPGDKKMIGSVFER